MCFALKLYIFAEIEDMVKDNGFIQTLQAVAKSIMPRESVVVLYGSRARGDYNEYSDWDILILLDKESIESEDYDKYSYPLVASGFETEQVVIPVIMTKQEWADSVATPFYRNVSRDAVSLV